MGKTDDRGGDVAPNDTVTSTSTHCARQSSIEQAAQEPRLAAAGVRLHEEAGVDEGVEIDGNAVAQEEGPAHAAAPFAPVIAGPRCSHFAVPGCSISNRSS